MNEIKSIRARVVFLPADQGGRKHRVFSGYRPAIYFKEYQTDAELNLAPGDAGLLGQELIVNIRLLHPEYLGDELKPNARFEIKEGSKVVGAGVVLET